MAGLVKKDAPPAYGFAIAHAPSKDLFRSWAKDDYGFGLLSKLSVL